jgi:hypothetical protein
LAAMLPTLPSEARPLSPRTNFSLGNRFSTDASSNHEDDVVLASAGDTEFVTFTTVPTREPSTPGPPVTGLGVLARCFTSFEDMLAVGGRLKMWPVLRNGLELDR